MYENNTLIENIALIIRKYVKRQNFSNIDSLLYEVINYIVKELHLENYINTVTILDFYDDNHSSKGKIDKNNNLFIYREGIKSDISKTLQKETYLSDFEKLICKIILYIKTILHELEHVKQNKLLIEDKQNNSIETLILRAAKAKEENGFANMSNIGYKMYYDLHPSERLAEITAYRSIVKILEAFGNNIENLTTFFKKRAIYEELVYYVRYPDPTIKYLSFFGNQDTLETLKQRISTGDISLSDRLLYGLEISEEEYNTVLGEYERLERLVDDSGRKKGRK